MKSSEDAAQVRVTSTWPFWLRFCGFLCPWQVFVFGFFRLYLLRNDIWSISWYDINSTHEHVVLLFIEFSDILKALTLKQIIMITRFMAASQRKHTNNQLRYRYRASSGREDRRERCCISHLNAPLLLLPRLPHRILPHAAPPFCHLQLVSVSYLAQSVACPSFLQFDGLLKYYRDAFEFLNFHSLWNSY